MTTEQLQHEFDNKRNLLWEMLEAELIDETTYEATLNRVKDETFFAVAVQHDIDNLPSARAA